MQRVDLSRHIRIKALVSRNAGVDLPHALYFAEPEQFEVWAMEDAALYRWRGLVPKVTANRLTLGIDYEINFGALTLKSGDPGAERELILVVK